MDKLVTYLLGLEVAMLSGILVEYDNNSEWSAMYK